MDYYTSKIAFYIGNTNNNQYVDNYKPYDNVLYSALEHNYKRSKNKAIIKQINKYGLKKVYLFDKINTINIEYPTMDNINNFLFCFMGEYHEILTEYNKTNKMFKQNKKQINMYIKLIQPFINKYKLNMDFRYCIMQFLV